MKTVARGRHFLCFLRRLDSPVPAAAGGAPHLARAGPGPESAALPREGGTLQFCECCSGLMHAEHLVRCHSVLRSGAAVTGGGCLPITILSAFLPPPSPPSLLLPFLFLHIARDGSSQTKQAEKSCMHCEVLRKNEGAFGEQRVCVAKELRAPAPRPLHLDTRRHGELLACSVTQTHTRIR